MDLPSVTQTGSSATTTSAQTHVTSNASTAVGSPNASDATNNAATPVKSGKPPNGVTSPDSDNAPSTPTSDSEWSLPTSSPTTPKPKPSTPSGTIHHRTTPRSTPRKVKVAPKPSDMNDLSTPARQLSSDLDIALVTPLPDSVPRGGQSDSEVVDSGDDTPSGIEEKAASEAYYQYSFPSRTGSKSKSKSKSTASPSPSPSPSPSTTLGAPLGNGEKLHVDTDVNTTTLDTNPADSESQQEPEHRRNQPVVASPTVSATETTDTSTVSEPAEEELPAALPRRMLAALSDSETARDLWPLALVCAIALYLYPNTIVKPLFSYVVCKYPDVLLPEFMPRIPAMIVLLMPMSVGATVTYIVWWLKVVGMWWCWMWMMETLVGRQEDREGLEDEGAHEEEEWMLWRALMMA